MAPSRLCSRSLSATAPGLPVPASSVLGFHGHGLWKVPRRLPAPARDSFRKPPASAPFRVGLVSTCVGLGIVRVGLGIARVGPGLLLAKDDLRNRGGMLSALASSWVVPASASAPCMDPLLSALASPWMAPASAPAPAHEYCLGRPRSGLRFGPVSASASAPGPPQNSSLVRTAPPRLPLRLGWLQTSRIFLHRPRLQASSPSPLSSGHPG